MKTPLRLIVTLGTVVVLTAACNPFGASSRERLPEDPRFAKFTFDSDNKPTVQERTDSFNERWPGMQATEGHVTIEYSPSDPFPNPDPEFWLTGVATVPDETITALMEGTTSSCPASTQASISTCHRTVTSPPSTQNTPTRPSRATTLRSTRTSELYPSKHLQRQATATSS